MTDNLDDGEGVVVMENNGLGVAAEPPGSRPSDGAASSGVSTVPASIPNAICGYPLPGWRLDHVQWDEREGQPDGWIVCLKREHPNWRTHRHEFVVMVRSDIGPLEAWDEALKVAIRSDERETRNAQAIEARRAATAKTGAVEDESAVGNADAPTLNPGDPNV